VALTGGKLATHAVRRARPGDAFAIRRLLRELGYDPGDARAADETMAQVVRHPEAAVFVAVDGVEVIGYVAMSHRPQMRLGGRLASIDELVVATARRGEGCGTQLLDAAIAHARSLHCVRIDVQQGRKRESYERSFYRKRGFVEVDSALLRIELS
jgi:N-acetylglutamate synthase-like GNAT family acetyltransferase